MSRWTMNNLSGSYDALLSKIKRTAYINVTSEVLQATPVDSGSLRASWTASKGKTPKVNNVDITSGSASRAERNDIVSVIDSLGPNEQFNLANGQPYARRIEHGAHSPQAPQGMLGVSAAKWEKIIMEAIQNVT